MSWILEIQRGGGGPVSVTSTPQDPRGVLGGFKWRTAGSGDCITCEFDAFVDQLGLRNRDLITVSLGIQPLFFGPVVELPHPRDPRRGKVNAVGARELLGRRVIGRDKYTNYDVGAIARDLAMNYRHPALRFDPALIPDTGRVLSEFTMPWRTLEQALDTLSKSVGGDRPLPFGVQADGRIFFGNFSDATLELSVAELSDLQWLRVSGDEVVTSSYLIALNKLSGTEPLRIGNYPIGYVEDSDFIITRPTATGISRYGAKYDPATYVMRADDPNWSGLQTEAANLVPDGADVLNAPGVGIPSPSYLIGLVNPAALSDGDPATFAQNDPAAADHIAQYNLPIGASSDPVIGFRLVYSLSLAGYAGEWKGEATLEYSYPNPAGETPDRDGDPQLLYGTLIFDYRIPDTKGAMQEIIAICPMSEQMMAATLNGPLIVSTPTPYAVALNAGVNVANPSVKLPASAYKVYSFEPIFLDRPKVDTLARKFLRPPAQEPTELTLRGLRSPMFSVTLTDAPGGAVTGTVAEIEGSMDPKEGVKTVIKLEQPGASVQARMLRLVAVSRAQDAQTQLRGFLER